MRKTVLLAVLIIFFASALAIAPSANGVPQGITTGHGTYVSGVRIILLKSIVPDSGSSEGVQIIPPPRGHDTVTKGTLKIEMFDGSVQEIHILTVKRAMIDYGL